MAIDESEQPKTLTDQACMLIRDDIAHGKFAPGSKLRIEALKDAYGFGATPLREALYRLSAEGFVTVQGQRGFRVADISVEDLEDITNLRVVIEGMALTQSIENADDDWESEVVAAFHHLTKAESGERPDIYEWEKRNTNFHLALISRCSSNWLMRFYELLYDQHKRYRNIARMENTPRRDIHAEHTTICEAALAHDAAATCAANEIHIRETAKICDAVLRESEDAKKAS